VSGVGTPVLVGAFLVGAVATWVAGIYLSRATDGLDERLHIGEALGGMVLLAISGTLPEIAITVTAALQGHLDIAAGNLIGGIAVQTMVLVICDFMVVGDRPLSYLVGSLIPVLEASTVVGLVGLVLLGSLLPASVTVGGVSPASIAIVIGWFAGVAILYRVRNAPAWEVTMPGSRPGRPHRRIPHPTIPHPYAKTATSKLVLIFSAAGAITLVAGVALAASGEQLASRAGINGVVFGATFLALATALPEISTGIAAIKLGDNELAMGDIFGGNAFQVCLFLVADLIAGRPVLTAAGPANAWLATLGVILSAVYAVSAVVRPTRRFARLGADSIVAIVVFTAGTAGLLSLAK
jgi:cation:H+ antiporter